MTIATDLITELMRAANHIDRVDHIQRRRLIERADEAIREMRMETGIAPSPHERDLVIDIFTIGSHADDQPDETCVRAMLDAADLIRMLHITLDERRRTRR